jgi:hypothetical protein
LEPTLLGAFKKPIHQTLRRLAGHPPDKIFPRVEALNLESLPLGQMVLFPERRWKNQLPFA